MGEASSSRNFEKVEQEAKALREKAEAVLSPEDVAQILLDHADYVPAVEARKG